MTQVPSYDPAAVEARWQERWARERSDEPDLDQPRRPFYNLMMFPYPSAEGLHVGNMFAFTGADIYGRFKRLHGYDVLEPIGFDAFGIHSENYALSVGTHPAKLIPQNIETFRRQLRRFGGMFDWRHELSTTDPRYYKWTQWIFLQLFKAGIAFRKKAAVNWCPKDMSVVANEQVINGFCERHPDTKVEQRFLEQWFFKITRYAERLLENLDQLDWSDSTRTLQRNWIGRSEGAELIFETPAGAKIPVFTTRPDTVFGATYMVLAPELDLVDEIVANEWPREAPLEWRGTFGLDVSPPEAVEASVRTSTSPSYAVLRSACHFFASTLRPSIDVIMPLVSSSSAEVIASSTSPPALPRTSMISLRLPLLRMFSRVVASCAAVPFSKYGIFTYDTPPYCSVVSGSG